MRYRLQAKELTSALAALEQRRWLFESLPIDPTHAEWLRRRAWLRSIHSTTRIEGNTLSDVEVETLLGGEGSARMTEREAREIIGTRDALALVDRRAADGVAPDEAVLREVHRLVLWNQSPLLTPGEYRRGGNRVVDADGNLVFATPVSGDVPELMRELGAWLVSSEGLHPVPVVAALGHLELVAIHPFNDGNGRTARALSRMFLARGGYAFDGLVSLDARLSLDRSSYFAAIRTAIGSGYAPGYDATPFVAYFLDSMVQSADFVLARIRALGEVTARVRRAIADGILPATMLDGLAFAWVNRHVRARDYRRLTGRSPQATTRDLAAAVSAGWLVATGQKRGRYYLLGPQLLESSGRGDDLARLNARQTRARQAHRSGNAPVSVSELVAAGLATTTEDMVRPGVRLTPVADILVAHDRDGMRHLPRDHVLGVGAATRTLAALTVRRPVSHALDMGTGSGAQALLASRHAEHVVAVDISERACWLARLNIELNGITNIDVRAGDGFAAVPGERFDLIVANPPFVISPDSSFVFRDGRASGDAVSRDTVRNTADALSDGGYASVLVNWVVRDEDEPAAPVQGWLADLPCDSLVIHHDTLDPVRYAERWILGSRATEPVSHARAVERWLRYDERIGARAIASGAVIMRRTGERTRVRVERMTSVPDEGGAQLERVLAAFGRFEGPTDPRLLEAVPSLVGPHRLEQHLDYHEGAYEAHPATLRLERSAGITAKVPADLLEALFLTDGSRSLGTIVDGLAEARGAPVDEIRAHALPVFLELYELGFLTLES